MKKAFINKKTPVTKNHNTGRHLWFWISVLTLITLWVYFPGLHNRLTNWDDNYYILQNKHIAPINFENLKHYFTAFYIGNYHPFTLLSYAIDYHFFKSDPFPYHVINLIFHILNSILVIFLIQKLTGKFQVCVLCGFLFAVHPLHVESVVWVSEKKDVMFLFFYLLGMLSYMRYRQNEKLLFLFFALVAFIFSCLFKAMAVSFPAALVLVDYLKGYGGVWNFGRGGKGDGRVGGKRVGKNNYGMLIDKIPFLAFSVLFGILALLAQKSAAAVNIFTDHTLWDRMVFVSYGLVFYPLKLLVPFNLSPYYPYPDKINGILPLYLLIYPVVFLLLCLTAYWLFRKKFQQGIFGILFYLATIFPVIQVVQVGEAIVADRYSYLPSLGIFVIFGFGVEKIFEFYRNSLVQKAVLLILSGYIIWFCLYSRHRCTIWKDSVTLWTDALEQFPTFALGYYNRSNEYIQRSQFEIALADLDKALAVKPDYAHALNNRGYCLHLLGKNKEAYPDLKRASELDPSYSDPLNNLGVVCFQLGKPDSAIYYFKKGLEVSPEFGELYKNTGAVYHNMGDYKNAVIYYEKALKFYPEDKNIQMYLLQLYGLMEERNK